MYKTITTETVDIVYIKSGSVLSGQILVHVIPASLSALNMLPVEPAQTLPTILDVT